MPFNEVLKTGKPDFPFCLSWANHDWEAKLFVKGSKNKMLIKQLYPGKDDYIAHFNILLPAFKDNRYIRVDNKPLFQIYSPLDIPDIEEFVEIWQKMAKQNGFEGIHFVGHTLSEDDIEKIISKGFEAVNTVRLFDLFKKKYSLPQRAYMKMMRVWFNHGQLFDYRKVYKYFSSKTDEKENCYPSIIPNWDHSPRSGRKGHIFVNSNPEAFKNHVKMVLETMRNKKPEHRIAFIKSWNEWGEGNYMEPDLKFGKGYLEALKQAIDEF
jgi:hypothetical protein